MDSTKLLFISTLLITWTTSSAQDVTISPEGQVVVSEGESFNITCTDRTSVGRGDQLVIRRNGVTDTNITRDVNGMEVTFSIGPVMLSDNGTVFSCQHGVLSVPASSDVVLVIRNPPVYSLSGQTTIVVEGDNHTYTFNLTSDTPIAAYNWTKDGVDTGGNGRIVTTATSITITNVMRSDSGAYQVFGTNSVGTGTATFTLDVQYPPELSVVPVVRNLSPGGVFTLDCTPVTSNPSANVTFYFNSVEITSSSDSVNITGYVLTIPSITRKQRGTYSCNASNSAGSDVAEVNVTVNAPPTPPRSLNISNPQPFSSNVSWSPPEDNGGDPNPLTYRINVTNDTVTMMYNTSGLELQLTNLQHSTNYTVSLVAVNVFGSSQPTVVDVFRTSDTEPIIHNVTSSAVSLNNITVFVTFLTDGGQSINLIMISVNNVMVSDSSTVSNNMVSIDVGNLNLTKGTDYNVSVTANNSIGTSEPVTGTLSVPNPPNPTAPPSELSPSNITTCCAGVRLNLADPDDVSDVSVLLNTSSDGSYEMVSAGNLTRSGDILYIMGLQAGTVYTASITVSNIFGSTTQQTTLKPLLGRPSGPAGPTVTSDGTAVTVVLSTDYPGTERMRSGSMFSFQLQFTKDGRSARQSDTQVVPATPSGLSSPVTTTYQGVLSGGSYTVRVTAVNEHGSSESVVSEEFVVTEPTQPADSTPVIVGVVIGVVVAILLVIIIIFVGVILYMKFWKNKGHYLMKKESDTPSTYATNGSNNEKGEIEMIPNQPAVLYAAVDNSKMSQKEKEVADGHYDDPDVTKPPTTEGLVYADLEFTKKTKDYKKPPPKAEETVIYSEVTLQQQPPQGGSDRDERTNSPTTIM